jgi:long-chain acyl-CoA synthetase
VAFVVPRPGAAPTQQMLKDFVLANAAPHLHPRMVWFIDRMPLAGTNKIDRHALKAQALRSVQADKVPAPGTASP